MKTITTQVARLCLKCRRSMEFTLNDTKFRKNKNAPQNALKP